MVTALVPVETVANAPRLLGDAGDDRLSAGRAPPTAAQNAALASSRLSTHHARRGAVRPAPPGKLPIAVLRAAAASPARRQAGAPPLTGNLSPSTGDGRLG
jgi:hypothetical protein